MKRLDVEPDFQAWREYALGHGVHPAVITYLDVEQDHFYHLETTPDGKEFVTARGWDDLSSAIRLYEAQDLPVDEVLIGQYVQAPQIAKRFAVYYDLFTKYRADYQVDRVLAGTAGPEVVERAQAAPFDERVSVVGLLSDALAGVLREAVLEEGAVEFAHPRLAAMRDKLDAAGAADATEEVRAQEAEVRRLLRTDRASGLLSEQKYRSYERAIDMLQQAQHLGAQTGALTFDQVKEAFSKMLGGLESRVEQGEQALDRALAFAEQAFGEGQEMLLLITDLSANRYSMAFINAHGSERFFKHNSALLFGDRGADLAARIKQTRARRGITPTMATGCKTLHRSPSPQFPDRASAARHRRSPSRAPSCSEMRARQPNHGFSRTHSQRTWSNENDGLQLASCSPSRLPAPVSDDGSHPLESAMPPRAFQHIGKRDAVDIGVDGIAHPPPKSRAPRSCPQDRICPHRPRMRPACRNPP